MMRTAPSASQLLRFAPGGDPKQGFFHGTEIRRENPVVVGS